MGGGFSFIVYAFYVDPIQSIESIDTGKDRFLAVLLFTVCYAIIGGVLWLVVKLIDWAFENLNK